MSEPLSMPDERHGPDERGGLDRVLLLACLLACTRFLYLGRWSLWIDEAYTLADALHPADSLNPLGYALFREVYGWFDARPDEAGLRLPAAVFGFLCVPLTYWGLTPLLRPRARSVAALIVAVSPWHLHWSQTARFYTMAQALTLLGTGLLWRGLIRGRSASLALGFLCLVASVLTHPSSIMLVGPCLMVAFLARLRGEAAPAPGRGPWILLGVLTAAGLALGARWGHEVFELWDARQGSGNPRHLILSAGYLISPPLGLAMLLGAWRVVRRPRGGEPLLLAIGACGLSLALVASFFVRVSAQYAFVLMPYLAGVAALCAVPLERPAGKLWTRLLGRPGLNLCLVLVPMVADGALYFTLRHGDRPRWREAYRYVFERREWSDLVLGMQAPVAQYYWAPWSDDPRSWDRLIQFDSLRARVPREWIRYHRTMWFVVNHETLRDWGIDDRQRALRMLAERCTLEASFEVPWTPRDLDVHVYRHDPADPFPGGAGSNL